jgi:MYXO-CTERM domain-containing protein
MNVLVRTVFFLSAGLLLLPAAALAVDADGDGEEDDVDCDDNDPHNFFANTEVCDGQDNDCSGTADFDHAGEVDVDEDGALSCEDCDDDDDANFPDNDEICDGQDNDCDDLVDDDDEVDPIHLLTWYPDADGDGEGVLPAGPTQCAPVPGHGSLGGADCDDGNPDKFHGNIEVCDDGIDQDCDERDTRADDDQDGDGENPSVCGGEGTDCDDNNNRIGANQEEICDDGIDQNCDGRDTLGTDDFDGDGENPLICFITGGTDCDDFDASLHSRDDDGDGAAPCYGDCDDDEPLAHPALDEICDDGIDNDCSGGIDDIDLDGDGWISPDCEGGDDCDDDDPRIHPAEEGEKGEEGATCADEIDNDCDGLLDALDDDCFLEPEVDGGVSRQDRYLGGTILVSLDGSATTDGNLEDTLVYTWTMLTDASAYPGVTAELITDPSLPVAYLRFSAEPDTDLNKWVFDFQLVVSDGIFTTEFDDDSGAVRVEIYRPTVFALANCSAAAPARTTPWTAALALGLLGLIRRRSRRTL